MGGGGGSGGGGVYKDVNVSLVFINTGAGGRNDNARTEDSDSDLSSRTSERNAEMGVFNQLQLHYSQQRGASEVFAHCYPHSQRSIRRLSYDSLLPFRV